MFKMKIGDEGGDGGGRDDDEFLKRSMYDES
jgi:hypothetical protein